MANRDDILAQVRFRTDSADNWEAVDPVLAQSEPAYDVTNNILKIGDGSSTWSQLNAINSNAVFEEVPATSTTDEIIAYGRMRTTSSTVGSWVRLTYPNEVENDDNSYLRKYGEWIKYEEPNLDPKANIIDIRKYELAHNGSIISRIKINPYTFSTVQKIRFTLADGSDIYEVRYKTDKSIVLIKNNSSTMYVLYGESTTTSTDDEDDSSSTSTSTSSDDDEPILTFRSTATTNYTFNIIPESDTLFTFTTESVEDSDGNISTVAYLGFQNDSDGNEVYGKVVSFTSQIFDAIETEVYYSLDLIDVYNAIPQKNIVNEAQLLDEVSAEEKDMGYSVTAYDGSISEVYGIRVTRKLTIASGESYNEVLTELEGTTIKQVISYNGIVEIGNGAISVLPSKYAELSITSDAELKLELTAIDEYDRENAVLDMTILYIKK